MRNRNFGQMQQMMMMQNAMRQQEMPPFQPTPSAPAQTALSMPPMQNVVAPQAQPMQGYQGMNPMAMAQMLRGRFGGARTAMPTAFGGINPMPRPPMTGVSGMGDAMGTGINPNAGNIYGGISPMGNRQAFMNFINSLNRG
jgi:hypothetical protein